MNLIATNKEQNKVRYKVKVGNVAIGGGEEVVVQSMTNTLTADVVATVEQVIQLYNAGSKIVRITVNDHDAAQAVGKIKNELRRRGYDIPLVGCFHYNGHILLNDVGECAEALDKYRINPGNVGAGSNRDLNFEKIVRIAMKNEKPIRIGVNWGSLDKMILSELRKKHNITQEEFEGARDINLQIEAVILSALRSAEYAQSIGMSAERIVLSAKVSDVSHLVYIYRELAKRGRYALHLGLTEAGGGLSGIINTSSALAILLADGIGDTIRASVTQQVGEPRTSEVRICYEVLQALGIYSRYPRIISCPGCGRTGSDYFQKLTTKVNSYIERKIQGDWIKMASEIAKLHIAVMGCVVNGPGESKHADIGISLPGYGEIESAPVFIDGERRFTLRGDDIDEQFLRVIDDYIKERFFLNFN